MCRLIYGHVPADSIVPRSTPRIGAPTPRPTLWCAGDTEVYHVKLSIQNLASCRRRIERLSLSSVTSDVSTLLSSSAPLLEPPDFALLSTPAHPLAAALPTSTGHPRL